MKQRYRGTQREQGTEQAEARAETAEARVCELEEELRRRESH